MSNFTDQAQLVGVQYGDASNLDARIRLHREFSTNPYPFHRWSFDHVDLPAEARILEAGTGSGAFWRENADRIPRDWHVTLTDLSPGMLEDAEHALSRFRTFTFQQADVQVLPFGDDSFDAVLANHMLYHVPDRSRALAEIRRVLAAGGRLYAATNGAGHLRELRALLGAYADNVSEIGELDFSLENGADQLRAFFDEVTLDRYEDALNITQAAPLNAYVRSINSHYALTADQLTAVEQRVDELIARGPIHIRKEVGLFTAK